MASIGNITFVCSDPERMATFWAGALGYVLQDAPPEFMEAWIAAGRDPGDAAAAVDPSEKGPRLFFIRGEKRPEVADTSIPIHLDLSTDDPDREVARLIELGATKVEVRTRTTGEFTEIWTVMQDPEGNGFCVQ